jgi:predicted site-specific integrase-resolvase
MGRRYYTHDQYLEYLGIKNKGQGQVIVYARVSSYAQKPDLKNQVKALREYCYEHEIQVDEWVKEIGSALNYKRKKFNNIFEQIELGQVSHLIVAQSVRLVRFGFEWFENFCFRLGTKLMIVDGDSLSPEQEMVQDLLSIVHVFSARLYGLRSYKKLIKDACIKSQNTDKKSNN